MALTIHGDTRWRLRGSERSAALNALGRIRSSLLRVIFG